MSKKKLKREKIEGLEEIAHVFGVEGVVLERYLSHSDIKKLGEKMGEEVKVMGIILSASKTGTSVFLLAHPKEKDKCLLFSPNEDFAKKFYDALYALEKKEGE